MMLFGLPLVSLAVGTAGAQNRHVVNDYLEQVLSGWPPDQDIEVLVRFSSDPTVYDRGHLFDAGLEPRHTFHVVPTVYAVGRPDAVWRASLDPRVAWIEWNRPLEYMMDNSTFTVNATRVWNAVVKDQSLQYPEIDGRGVTVAIVDSGVDAGHPDLNYGSKVLLNLKSDSNLVWYQVENSDTSSGHGTHVAGTVAGNGDVSAGARRGVAPGANLVALSTGEATAILNALGALEWVYDNSRPGNNPYNIRCATNSWGTSGAPYDPNDSITIVTEKLTYDNNVVVTFAAGNDGSNDHDGSRLSTNPYSNTPAAISVAAYTRDGSGMTTFSSRGLATDNATWPDIGAPGLAINSTRARLTLITLEVCAQGLPAGKDYQCDPYYMAISGTSMATPHVAGEVALLFQAAPSLRVSDYHADYGSASNSSEDQQNWFTNPRTRIHETELIMKLTANFLKPGNNSVGGDNFVPQYNGTTGMLDLPRDYAQGYGMADMNQAIALALVLQKMRSMDPKVTVLDAYYQWKGLKTEGRPVATDRDFSSQTDTLVTGWSGEFTRYNDQNGKVLLVQNSTKLVFVPNGTTSIDLDLTYSTINLVDRSAGTVNYMVEKPDGSSLSGSLLSGNGHKTATIDVGGAGGDIWKFSVTGAGVRLQDRLPPYQYKEMRLPYSFGLRAHLATSPDAPIVLEPNDLHASYAQWRFEDNGSMGSNGSIVMRRPVFDLTNVKLGPRGPAVPSGGGVLPGWLLAVLGLLLLGVAAWYLNEQRVKAGKGPLPGIAQANRLVDRLRLRRAVTTLKSLPSRLKMGGLVNALKRQAAGLKGIVGKLRPKRAA